MGDLAEDGQHRPLGRVPDRRVGGVGGLGEGRGDQDRVDQLARPGSEFLGGAADDLAEDHAAVATSPHQGGAGQGGDQFGPADLVERLAVVEPVELFHHRLHGHRHVVPGVAVGNGENVQVIDLLPTRFKRPVSSSNDPLESLDTRIRHDG